MSSLRTIRRRIRSIQNIHEITKAMEMISAVRFKRVEQRFHSSLPYGDSLEAILSRLLSEEVVAENPFFAKRDKRKELLVMMTGDRGLCGSFNSNLLRYAEIYLAEHTDREISVYSVGKVGTSFARRRGWNLIHSLSDVGYRFTPESLKSFGDFLVSSFLSGRFDEINLLSMSFSKGVAAKPALETYLGLYYLAEHKPADDRGMDYIFEPDRKTTLEALVHLFLKQRLFVTLLRSVAAEYNARLLAMKMATENAEDFIKELTLVRNKLRQASITEEIGEIMGGVNALG